MAETWGTWGFSGVFWGIFILLILLSNFTTRPTANCRITYQLKIASLGSVNTQYLSNFNSVWKYQYVIEKSKLWLIVVVIYVLVLRTIRSVKLNMHTAQTDPFAILVQIVAALSHQGFHSALRVQPHIFVSSIFSSIIPTISHHARSDSFMILLLPIVNMWRWWMIRGGKRVNLYVRGLTTKSFSALLPYISLLVHGFA